MDATVQTLVNQLSNNQADTTEMQNLYNLVVADFCGRGLLVTTVTQSISGGAVSLPADCINLLAVISYTSGQLGELSQREARWIDSIWNAGTGLSQPEAYNFVRDAFDQRTLRLVPMPPNAYQILIVYNQLRQTLPAYLQLPCALLIMYHEYTRESDHQNKDIAEASRVLAEFILVEILEVPSGESAK